MKKVVAALALLAAAGAWAQAGNKPDRQDIAVTVVDGRTTVSEEIAITTARHGAVVWKVQDGFRFADDGIVIEAKGRDKFRCQAKADGQRFRCAKLRHIKGARYKYVVNLVEDGSGRPLDPLDPFIQNN